MSATREEVVAAIGAARQELDRVVSSAAEDVWARPAYEVWTAKQLLCHVAATSGVAGFLLAMARNPGASFGGGLDQDELNAQQVAVRESKAIAEIADEARGQLERDVERVLAAPDELLAASYRAPWGYEGPLVDVIVDSLRDHLMTHLRDLAVAVA